MENHEDVIKALVDSLDDASEEVRDAATEALGKIGVAALPHLLKAVTYDEGYNIHKFIGAARALAQIGPDASEAIPALLRGLKFVPAQEEFVAAGSTIRHTAAAALGEICSDTSTTRFKAS